MSSAVEYIPRDTLVHRLNPLTKIIGSLALLTISIILDSLLYLGGVLVLVLACGVFAKISAQLLKAFKVLLIFAVILFLIQIVFYRWGQTAFYLIPGTNLLPVTYEGLAFGAVIALRMMIILTSFIIFLSTTHTRDMVMVLVEKVRVPYDYAFMFVTALRFIPTFLAEVKTIQEAQKARGYKLEGVSPLRKLKAYLPIALPLVLISLAKGENLALAMETRAYGAGVPRTYLKDWTIAARDVLSLLFFLVGIVLSIYLRFAVAT
ncbi:MAG: energy-coupling factor transporter transmembrane component T [Bacillota bacterium]